MAVARVSVKPKQLFFSDLLLTLFDISLGLLEDGSGIAVWAVLGSKGSQTENRGSCGVLEKGLYNIPLPTGFSVFTSNDTP